jgi:hypothetical protein
MDDLYTAGFRPTEARASSGQAAAMAAHIEDLRKSHDAVLKIATLMNTREVTIGTMGGGA